MPLSLDYHSFDMLIMSPLPLTGFTTIIVMIMCFWRWMKGFRRIFGSQPAKSELGQMTPYPNDPIKGKEKYKITMGLRRADMKNWLTIDNKYMPEHRVRDQLLKEERKKVFQCLPESQEACKETLEVVTKFLCERYPQMFEKIRTFSGSAIHNKETGETFKLGSSKEEMEPLEIAVRLAMEDINVLLPNDDGEYCLSASASLFPVGWAVHERIGWTIAQMHGPVPLWKEQVGHVVNKYAPPSAKDAHDPFSFSWGNANADVSRFLGRLTPQSPMERSNYFVEVSRPGESLLSILFRPISLSYDDFEPQPEHISIRRERQIFRRLPKSGGIIFSVKTSLTTLDQLPLEELQNLAKEIESWPEDVGTYKGRDSWGVKVLDFCQQRLAQHQQQQQDQEK
ncbi:hypothetical protein FQN54_001120 [Arachnomyces sp. PD_36]|nr:hypothetical protein FQN54_001120 [Arachnomyces sp. PD_36]